MFNGGGYNGQWEFRDYPRLFRTAGASDLGISRHKLFHTTQFPVVVAGVRMDPGSLVALATPTWADWMWMHTALRLRAVLMKFPDVAAGHVTAARLYGWPLPPGQPEFPIDVCSADEDARVRTRGVRLLRSKLFTTQQHYDMPIVGPAETFISLGRQLSVSDLVRIGDAAIGNWHGPPLLSLDRLRDAVAETQGVRARAHLLDALSLIRPTVDSPPETDLRLWTRDVGLPEPTVHPQIYCSSIDRIVEPDLGYEKEKLALEYEGDHHRTSKGQWNRDIERDEAMRLEGWTVLRVTSRTNYHALERKIRWHLGLE